MYVSHLPSQCFSQFNTEPVFLVALWGRRSTWTRFAFRNIYFLLHSIFYGKSRWEFAFYNGHIMKTAKAVSQCPFRLLNRPPSPSAEGCLWEPQGSSSWVPNLINVSWPRVFSQMCLNLTICVVTLSRHYYLWPFIYTTSESAKHCIVTISWVIYLTWLYSS